MGVRNGAGVCMYHRTGDVYDGEWAGNLKHGSGRYLYGDGAIYDGSWSGDLKHGQGQPPPALPVAGPAIPNREGPAEPPQRPPGLALTGPLPGGI